MANSCKYAVMLDGGFVRIKLKKVHHRRPVGSAQVIELLNFIAEQPVLQHMRLHRAYYYDAPPLETTIDKPDGSKLDLGASKLAKDCKALHSELISVPFLSVRQGELAFNGWQLKRNIKGSIPDAITLVDLKPHIEQKGVDMRIGLDMASITLKRHAEVIVLVTSDSDFVPAMKFARREGAQVILFTLGHGVLPVMREHADLVIESCPSPAV